MTPDPKLKLGDNIPWGEPAWFRQTSPFYNDSHRQLQKNIRAYIDSNILPDSLDWEEKGDAPRDEALRFAGSGIPFEDVPSQYRPRGVPNLAGVPHEKLDAFHALIATDEIARIEGGVGIALAGASSIGAPPIIHHGTEQQKRRWLPGLFSWKTSFSLGITEPSGGSDVANIQTTAQKSPDGRFYIVNGAKKWITGTPWASHMTTAVRTGGPGLRGVSMLVIPLNSPGITYEKIQNSGQNAGGASMVDLDNVKVPIENLIGQENKGFAIIVTNFNKERFTLAVLCNRKSRTCLALAFQYAMGRKTFGIPLIDSQVIRQKLGQLAQGVEAHWAWLEQLAYQVKSSPRGWQEPSIASNIGLAKVQGGRLVELAAREAQQIFGGAGYQRGGVGATIEQISRDLRMLVVGGGSEEILTDFAVRQEVADYVSRSKI